MNCEKCKEDIPLMWLMSLFGLWEKRPWIYSSLLICRHVCRVGVKWIEKPGLHQPRSAGRTVQPFLVFYPAYSCHTKICLTFRLSIKCLKLENINFSPAWILSFLFLSLQVPEHIFHTSSQHQMDPDKRPRIEKPGLPLTSPLRFFKRMLGRPNGSVCTHKN